MNVSHRTLSRLERGYSISLLPAPVGQEPSFVAGSEGEDRLLFFSAPEYRPEVIAREPGGYISTCPLFHGGARFIVAATMFKPGFNAAAAAIRLYPLDAGEYPESTWIADMPYTHRLAMLARSGRKMLLVSTLCAAKSDKEDWTQPGGVHLAEVPANPRQPWSFRQIVNGFNKNHGLDYAELGRERRPGYLLSAQEGLFFMPIPDDLDGDWPLEPIAAEESSDAFAYDWDGDGEPEVFSISPFHGHVLTLHKLTAGRWQRALIHDDLSMGHIVWAGELLGAPALLAGSRRGRRELRLYRRATDGGVDPAYQTIDEGIGPSQMVVWPRGPHSARLYMAAHGVDEVRIYELEQTRVPQVGAMPALARS
jgi:hypothetical protein